MNCREKLKYAGLSMGYVGRLVGVSTSCVSRYLDATDSFTPKLMVQVRIDTVINLLYKAVVEVKEQLNFQK